MAGGRPPKTTAELKLYGGFRADRHGTRIDELIGGTEPVKPELDDVGSSVWDLVITCLPRESKSALDAPALAGMCQWYSRYVSLMDRLVASVGEKEEYRLIVMTSMAWKQFEGSAARFGLSPVDRAKLKAPVKDGGLDEFEKFLEKHG
jgi:phage terminase small subunit